MSVLRSAKKGRGQSAVSPRSGSRYVVSRSDDLANDQRIEDMALLPALAFEGILFAENLTQVGQADAKGRRDLRTVSDHPTRARLATTTD